MPNMFLMILAMSSINLKITSGDFLRLEFRAIRFIAASAEAK
jgi:hypothetical protein